MLNSRWDLFSHPPSSALKQISGGRLRGMTDINPQWRYKVMDATYGACGFGWKYEIEDLSERVCDNGEVIVFARILLAIRVNNEWSAPIPGVGGSKLAAREKDGVYYTDECFKMAITDALSVAMKMLGVGSAIYEGSWNGSAYRDRAGVGSTTMPPENGADRKGGDPMDTAQSLMEAKTIADLAKIMNALSPEEQKAMIPTFKQRKEELRV